MGIKLSTFTLKITKSTYDGFCVLDISKLLMYGFHYNFIKKNYKEKATLLFTDTDSFMYEIETPVLYAELFEQKPLFYFSGYPPYCPFYDPTNKKLIGKLKDETNFSPILEFFGLKPKRYSYIKEYKEGGRRAKGIKSNVVEHFLTHQSFLEQINAPSSSLIENRSIRLESHHLFSISIRKKGLCSFDDKRFLLPYGIRTLSHGHHSINDFEKIDTASDNDTPASDEAIVTRDTATSYDVSDCVPSLSD